MRNLRHLWQGLSLLSWFATGGSALIALGIGAILGWPPIALVFLALGAITICLGFFVEKRQKMLSEQSGNTGGGFRSEAYGLVSPPGGFPIPRTMVGLHHGETKEWQTPGGRVTAIRLIQPRDHIFRAVNLPEQLRVGFIFPIWPKRILVKAFTDNGVVVEGTRTTGLGFEVELYYAERP